MRQFLLITASILVSGIFLALVLQGMPLAEIVERIRQADFLWVLLSFGSIMLAMWARAVRWRGLLPGSSITTTESLYILGVTFTLNLLPLRAGEVARSLLATRHGVPFMTAATSVVIERLVDTLLVVVLLAIALSRVATIPPETTRAASLFGVLAVFASGVLVFFARYPAIPRRILATILMLLPFLKRLPLENWLEHSLNGLEPLTHWRLFAHAVLWTLISWGISLGTLYLLHRSLNITDIDVALSTVLGVSLASLSIAIPVSVASLGPFEAAMKLAGQLAGMDEVRALSLGFLFHGISTLAYVVLGVISFMTLGVSLGEFLKPKNKTIPPDA